MRKAVALLGAGLFSILVLAPTPCPAIVIQATYEGTVPQYQQDIIAAAISSLELAFPGTTQFSVSIKDSVMRLAAPDRKRIYMLTPDNVVLAFTHAFNPTGVNGCPVSARIVFNSDVSWHWGLDPPPPTTYDGLSVATHELVHAIGFAIFYKNYKDCVDTVAITFRCGALLVYLSGSDVNGLSHVDDELYDGDLMTTTIGAGVRRLISGLDKAMIFCAFSECYDAPQAPALTEWGVVILVALIVFSAWVVWRRRRPVPHPR